MKIKKNDIIIKDSCSIKNAIRAINSGGLQICFVVNYKNILKGSISDGDIRRALLKGISIEDSIYKVINKKPFFINTNSDMQKIETKMISLGIKIAPVIDKNKKIVEIINIEKIEKIKKNDNAVIIMAGGLGTRLYPLTKKIPKPMIEIAGKPILEIIIERFISDGFKEFFICLNYKSEVIKNFINKKKFVGVDIDFIEEKKRLGTAGALSLIKKKFMHPVIIINGDILTKISFQDLLKHHQKLKAAATVAVREEEYEIPFGVIDYQNKTIKKIIEKPKNSFHVNSGIYVINPQYLKYVPKNKLFDMPSLINAIANKNKTVCSYLVNEYWLDIGRNSELEKARKDYE